MRRAKALRRSSTVVKRSVLIAGHATSLSLEDAFWSGLKSIAESRGVSTAGLLATIDGHRETSNLSSAVRVFVLDAYRAGEILPSRPDQPSS